MAIPRPNPNSHVFRFRDGYEPSQPSIHHPAYLTLDDCANLVEVECLGADYYRFDIQQLDHPLPLLKTVRGSLNLHASFGRWDHTYKHALPSLETVTKGLNAHRTWVSMPNLRWVEGNLDIRDHQGSLENLETVGGNLIAQQTSFAVQNPYNPIKIPKLRAVSGNLDVTGRTGSLDNLETIGGNLIACPSLYLHLASSLVKMPKVRTVAGDAWITEYDGNLDSLEAVSGNLNAGSAKASLPKLRSIGGGINIHNYQGSLDNLETVKSVNSFIDIRGSTIRLPSLTCVGEKVLSNGNEPCLDDIAYARAAKS